MNGNDEEAAEKLAVSARLFDSRDREKARNYASFVRGSVRRHRFLVFAVFVSIMGATVGSFFVLPKTYHVEAKALAQPTSASDGSRRRPGRRLPHARRRRYGLRQDNLLALIAADRPSSLHARASRARSTREATRCAKVASCSRRLGSRPSRRPGEAARREARRLDQRQRKHRGREHGHDRYRLADASMACRLVDAAQRAFLDARYAREITALPSPSTSSGGIPSVCRPTSTPRSVASRRYAGFRGMTRRQVPTPPRNPRCRGRDPCVVRA